MQIHNYIVIVELFKKHFDLNTPTTRKIFNLELNQLEQFIYKPDTLKLHMLNIQIMKFLLRLVIVNKIREFQI